MGVALLLLFVARPAPAGEPIHVRQIQGSVSGFLLLKSDEGKVIAVGELTNVARGSIVRSRVIFRFHDGSVDDEHTVFRQGSVFHLISDRHIQRGPSFPQPMDVLIDAGTGQITSRTEKDGKEEVTTEHIDLPPDLANGLVPAVLENLPSSVTDLKVGYIAGNPKPRLVALAIKPDGTDTFEIDGAKHKAIRYNIHVDLGGIAGVVAPIIGKEPTDTQIWVAEGEVRAFIKMQGALYLKGPIWTMELASPHWAGTGR